MASIEDNRIQSIPPHVREVIRRKSKGNYIGPQMADLASHFFEMAGGSKEVAKMLYTEFVAARPGSVVRQRIMDLVLRCVRFVNEKNPRGLSMENLKDQDLERELAEILGDMAGGVDSHESTGPVGASGGGDPDPDSGQAPSTGAAGGSEEAEF